jgi:hypothetical protein
VVCALVAGASERRWRWIVAAGVLAGLGLADPFERAAAPAAAVDRGVVGAAAARRRAATLAVVAVLAAAAVTISPWTIRNERSLHGFVPVATEVGPTLAGTYNDVARLDPVDPGAWWLPRQVPAIRAVVARHPAEPARDRILTRMALGYMVAHPLYVVRVVARNTLRLAELTPAVGLAGGGGRHGHAGRRGCPDLGVVLDRAGTRGRRHREPAPLAGHRRFPLASGGAHVPVGGGGDQRRALSHADSSRSWSCSPASRSCTSPARCWTSGAACRTT